MLKPMKIFVLCALAAITTFAAASCSSESAPPQTRVATPFPTSIPKTERLPEELIQVAGILSDTSGWPRRLESSEGIIEIPEPPQRILALSIGHDEMLLELLQSTERLAGVGEYTVYPEYSNIANSVAELTPVSAGVEQVLSVDPDVVIVSTYTDADFVALLKDAGVKVFRSELEDSIQGNIHNILALGYLIGEENNAIRLTEIINSRIARIQRAVPETSSKQARTLSLTLYGDSIWTSGGGSTTGRIIEVAGGINAAKEAGLESNLQISVESIIAMWPDYIIIPQAAESGGAELVNLLQNEPSLVSVPAIVSGNIDVVDPRHFTTLSHWNLCGVEDLALLLYPDEISELEGFEVCAPFFQ